MEMNGWKECRWNEKSTLSLIPPALDVYRTLYKEVVNAVSKWPFRKRLVVCIVIRGTHIKVDFGDVKAAGLVCALGVGFGLGTYVIYKLYSNYIRPAFNKDEDSFPEKIDNTSEDEDCFLYMGSSDSSTVFKMGNGSSSEDNEPPVHYSAEYGVAFGTDYRKKKVTVTEGVRLRPKRRDRQPSVQSDKDSAIGVPSELGQSYYSDAGFNRDSFYSTAESGFENMQESYDESLCDNCSNGRLPSLKGTQSPRVYNQRYNNKNLNDNHIPGYHLDNKPCVSTIDEENSPSHSNSTLPRTVIDPCSPGPSPGLHDTSWFNLPDKSHSPCYDPSLDQSESLRSFSGCQSDLDSSSWDGEDKSSPRVTNQCDHQSDHQFRQSLICRLKEWSNRSFDFQSRSPTPEIQIPDGLIRRSRSLDRQMCLLTTPDSALFENETLGGKTTENLEHIEDELHGIQDEFEEITSQINALIHRSNSQGDISDEPITFCAPSSNSSDRNSVFVDKLQQHFERRSSLPYNESINSSRAGSVDLTWDLDVDDGFGKLQNRRLCSNSADSSESNSAEHSEKNSPYRRCKQSPRRMSNVKLNEVDVFLESIEENIESPPKANSKTKKMNIGESVDIVQYADREWKGETEKAITIKQGYKQLPSVTNCQNLRTIRGDNYCAIRGCIYQMLTSASVCVNKWPEMMAIIDTLHQLYEDPTSGLSSWTFANRLPNSENKLSTICKCVLTLCSVVQEVSKLSTYQEREEMTLNLLNSHPDTDVEIMEGVKLLMLVKAVELFRDNQKGKDLPIFAYLMFARDTSDSICKFVVNHLNPVGDTGGLEQVEMCLLGQTIGTVITVARLSQFGAEDFTCNFPDETSKDWPNVYLIAEDDRHYNVPTP